VITSLGSVYDVAKHLRTPEEMVAYLEAAIEESGGDASFIATALGDIARDKGMTELSRETGLGRESLYKALSAEGNPQLSTVLKVAKALGLQIHVKPAA
jgi:probable addiction module antidote protein